MVCLVPFTSRPPIHAIYGLGRNQTTPNEKRQPREWRAEYGGRPREVKGGRVSGVYREQDRAQRLGAPHNEMGYSNGTLSCGTQEWSECFSVTDYPILSNPVRARCWQSKLPCRMSYASPEVNRMRMRLGACGLGWSPMEPSTTGGRLGDLSPSVVLSRHINLDSRPPPVEPSYSPSPAPASDSFLVLISITSRHL